MNLSEFWNNHHEQIIHYGKPIVLAVVVIILCWIACAVAKAMVNKSTKFIKACDDSVRHVIYVVIRTALLIVTCLIILDLFGFNTASILTILGAAGLTVGLAMKDSLSNIAAGIMLLLLRPYKTGDYIDCGSVSGTIKDMGLFSTVLHTPDGLFVSAPNSVLFGTPIKNYSRNPFRRTDITVGISYSDSLEDGIRALQKLMASSDIILKDDEHAPAVLVQELADSSVELTLRFWVASENYWDAYWFIKHGLKGAVEGAGLTIPFPQRVLTFANAAPEVKK